MVLSRRDLDELKPEVDQLVINLFGFNEPTLVTAALNCIDKGYDEEKTINKLLVIIDEKQAAKFSAKLFNVYNEFKSAPKNKNRKRKDEYIDHSVEPNKKARKEDLTPAPDVSQQQSYGQLTAEKIKDLMQSAQKAIQQRKVDLKLTTPITSLPPTGDLHMTDAVDKAKRAADLQARIQAKLQQSNIGSALSAFQQSATTGGATAAATGPGYKPQPLVLDDQGHTIDAATGETIKLTHITPTLKANIRAKRREEFKAVIEKPPEEIVDNSFFDPRVSIKSSQRGKRKFQFHEQGKYEKLASRLRTKAQLEKLQSDISKAAKKTGIASATKLATIQTSDQADDHIPEVEWWDSCILTIDNYDEFDGSQIDGISNLVEHPMQLRPPTESNKAVPLQVILTKKERKKLRRQNRNEAQKELQEKVRLGLLPPAEPKVRMANLMRVLGNEAIQDPTKVEAHVRAQMAKRQRAHEEANASRKLTKDQRREKKGKKLQEDTSLGLHVAVYRVRDLNNPARKFKIEANAGQLYMTGIVVCYSDCNIVVVEGGPKQQKKFKRLMMHRIKWTEERNVKDEDSDSEEEETKQNFCECVWEGEVKNRSFGELKIKVCPTERYAREHFIKHGVEHYWNFAYSDSVLKASGQDG